MTKVKVYWTKAKESVASVNKRIDAYEARKHERLKADATKARQRLKTLKEREKYRRDIQKTKDYQRKSSGSMFGDGDILGGGMFGNMGGGEPSRKKGKGKDNGRMFGGYF